MKGYLLLVSALVACPCHLPILLVLLAGTSLGGFLSAHVGLVAIGLTGYFVLALIVGARFLNALQRPANTAVNGRDSRDVLDCQACPDLRRLSLANRHGTTERRAT